MKKLLSIVAISATLASGAMASPHWGGYVGGGWGGPCYGYGGYWHGGGCDFWPALAFGIGFGALATGLDYHFRSTQPVYYPVPTSTYPAIPQAASSPAVTAPGPQPEPPAPAVWVPASPGTGTWVPDPQPYRFNPTSARPAPAARTPALPVTVSHTTSAGGVPVTAISR